MKKLLLTLLLASASLWGKPNDLQLVALDKALHGPQAEALYCQEFDGSASHALYDQQSINQVLLLNDQFIGFAISRDFITDNNLKKRHS